MPSFLQSKKYPPTKEHCTFDGAIKIFERDKRGGSRKKGKGPKGKVR
jgi:hypothetical protein